MNSSPCWYGLCDNNWWWYTAVNNTKICPALVEPLPWCSVVCSSDGTMTESTCRPWRQPGRQTQTRGYIPLDLPAPAEKLMWSSTMRTIAKEWEATPGETISWILTESGDTLTDTPRYQGMGARWGPGARSRRTGGSCQLSKALGGRGVTPREEGRECRDRDWLSSPATTTYPGPGPSSPPTATPAVSTRPPAQPPLRTRTLCHLLSYRTTPSYISTWPPEARGRRR